MDKLTEDQYQFWHLCNAVGLTASFRNARAKSDDQVYVDLIHRDKPRSGKWTYLQMLTLLYVIKDQGFLEENAAIPKYHEGLKLRAKEEFVPVAEGLSVYAGIGSPSVTLAIMRQLFDDIDQKVHFRFDPNHRKFSRCS